MKGFAKMWTLPALAATVGLVLAAGAPGASAEDKLSFAVPAIPPVFGGVVAYTAKEVGIFKRYGLDVTVKAMDSGAAAAKAVDSGSVDFAISPSQFIATMTSNAEANVVSIWGMDNPDWLIGSMDAGKTSCDSMKGQGVGVDSNRGARWIQLNTFLTVKCKLVTDKDVPTVPMSSNVGTAMAAGQITFGVLHIDDIPVIERNSGKKVHIVARIEDVSPGIHYLLGIVKKDNLAKKRDAFVRLVAALRDSVDYMNNPANLETVGKIAEVTKRELPDAIASIKAYNAMEFWPKGHPGLTKARVEAAIANQAKIGKITKGRSGINPEKTPVGYDKLVDLSVWADAAKMKK